MEVFPALSACSLFAGLTQDEIAAILPCLSARQAGFRRGQFLLRAGDEVRFAGVVLAGEVELLQEDFWGNRNLLAAAGPGELFAEAFACVQARAPVSVLCKTDGCVLYLDTHAVFFSLRKGLRAAPDAVTESHPRAGGENMQLNEGRVSLAALDARKLLAYLSAQARRTGSASFRIPFDRQQLADFLSVNRSAMSAELSKMQREGLLRAERADFTLFQPE